MAIEVICDLNDPRVAMFTGGLSDDLFIAESPAVIEKALPLCYTIYHNE